MTEAAEEYDVEVGDAVLLRAVEQGGGGYSWSCDVPSDAADRLVLESSTVEPQSAAIGAAATRAFSLRALGPGTTTVLLQHKRPWESEAIEERAVVIRASTRV